MKNSFLFRIVCLMAAIMLLLPLTACKEKPAVNAQPVMTEVYDDGMYVVDAGKIQYIPTESGGQDMLVRLHIANRTQQPLIISTRLGVRAADGENELPCSSPSERHISGTDVLRGINGRVAPDGFVDGWIVLPELGEGQGNIKVSIATDYCNDSWISFELQR